jgi:uncharacterized protein (DUF1501 family)
MAGHEHEKGFRPGGGVTRRELLSRLVFAAQKPEREEETRTVVVVFLRGGADTLNMLVPCGDDFYYRKRPTLAIPGPGDAKAGVEARAIKIDDFYGFHPGMKALEGVYKEGRLACVQAVGSDNTTGSHFSAQDQIEHGEGAQGKAGSGGWLGRYLRVLSGGGLTPLSAVAIGSAMPESLRGAPSASVFETLAQLQMSLPAGEDPARVGMALSRMYGAQVGVLGERGGQTLALLKRVEKLRNGDAGAGGAGGVMAGGGAMAASLGVGYDGSAFSKGLGELARLITADVGLRVGCIDLPGWDTHFVQGGATGLQAGLIGQLGNGLAGFDAQLGEHRERVTTVVMTEFGRRLYENASLGTDHGRGFCMFVMGGRVAGGRVVGAWPGFEQKGFADADLPGPGGLKVETDYRAVLGEILADGAGGRGMEGVFPGYGGQGGGLGILKKRPRAGVEKKV